MGKKDKKQAEAPPAPAWGFPGGFPGWPGAPMPFPGMAPAAPPGYVMMPVEAGAAPPPGAVPVMWPGMMPPGTPPTSMPTEKRKADKEDGKHTKKARAEPARVVLDDSSDDDAVAAKTPAKPATKVPAFKGASATAPATAPAKPKGPPVPTRPPMSAQQVQRALPAPRNNKPLPAVVKQQPPKVYKPLTVQERLANLESQCIYLDMVVHDLKNLLAEKEKTMTQEAEGIFLKRARFCIFPFFKPEELNSKAVQTAIVGAYPLLCQAGEDQPLPPRNKPFWLSLSNWFRNWRLLAHDYNKEMVKKFVESKEGGAPQWSETEQVKEMMTKLKEPTDEQVKAFWANFSLPEEHAQALAPLTTRKHLDERLKKWMIEHIEAILNLESYDAVNTYAHLAVEAALNSPLGDRLKAFKDFTGELVMNGQPEPDFGPDELDPPPPV